MVVCTTDKSEGMEKWAKVIVCGGHAGKENIFYKT